MLIYMYSIFVLCFIFLVGILTKRVFFRLSMKKKSLKHNNEIFFFYLKLVLLENVFKTTKKIWKWAGNGRFSYCGDFGIQNK